MAYGEKDTRFNSLCKLLQPIQSWEALPLIISESLA